MGLTTTTIGAYPKPDYIEVPDWFNMPSGPDTAEPTVGWAKAVEALGDHAEEVFARGVKDVIDDQVGAGIDVPTDGEVRRENYIHYHCRHLDGIDFENLTKKMVRGVFSAKLPTITGPIAARGHFLPHDWRTAQACTDCPVKITMPGPMTISDTVYDGHYGRPEDALAYGFEHLERCFHGCPEGVVRTVHMCCGYPDRLDHPDYPKAPQESYARIAQAIEDSCIMAISIEDAHRHNDLSLLESFETTAVILGVVAIAKSRVEPVEEIRERLAAALEHIDAGWLIAAPDCGLGLLGRELTLQKLRNLSEAAHSLGS
jgi:5-methyltetrahydropteroyltriglutamate--homocysteine methyltransferase